MTPILSEPPTKRGKARVYEYIKKFNTVEGAKKYFKDSTEPWGHVRNQNEFMYYACRECTMRGKLEVNSNDLTADVYQTEGSHIHVLKAQRGLSKEVSDKIEKLFDSGVTLPTSILAQLKKENVSIEKPKLSNFLARLKKKNLETAQFN